MLKTRGIPLRQSDVDDVWVFQYYMKLPAGLLSGGDHKVRSPWNRDTDPSFSIYKPAHNPQGKYRWRDFSSGQGGDIIDLVAMLNNLPTTPQGRRQAFNIIRRDFSNYLDGNEHVVTAQKENTKGRVTDWELRKWTAADYTWWDQFGITYNTLDKFNVAPMKRWTMDKTTDGDHRTMTFDNPRAYGYLTAKGELGRIYQPDLPKAKGKFIKVAEGWIQGRDQLKFENPELLVMSSLKDTMCVDELGFLGFEYIVSDSETIMLPKDVIELIKNSYQRIRVFFNSDAAGRAGAAKYLPHGFTSIDFSTMEKDPSDSVKKYNQLLVKIELIPILK